eukprot:1051173-Ditylum_brightwellii.AAC.1
MATSASMVNESSSWQTSFIAVAGSMVMSSVRGLAWPVLGSAINGAIDDNSLRATALSLFAGMIKAGMIVTGLVLGMVLKVEQKGSE